LTGDVFFESPAHTRLKEIVYNIIRKEWGYYAILLDKRKPGEERVDLEILKPSDIRKRLMHFPSGCDHVKVECLTWYRDVSDEFRVNKLREKLRFLHKNTLLVFAIPRSRIEQFIELIGRVLSELPQEMRCGEVELWAVDIRQGRIEFRIPVPPYRSLHALRLAVRNLLAGSGFTHVFWNANDPFVVMARYEGPLTVIEGECKRCGYRVLVSGLTTLSEVSTLLMKSKSKRRRRECPYCGRRGRSYRFKSITTYRTLKVAAICTTQVEEDTILSHYLRYEEKSDVCMFFFLRAKPSDVSTLRDLTRRYNLKPDKVQFHLKMPDHIWFEHLSPIVDMREEARLLMPKIGEALLWQRRLTSFFKEQL